MNSQILYIPHGGGPMPLLDEPNHRRLADFLSSIGEKLARPKAILVISAHWETDIINLSSGTDPELIYDYYGFPPKSYQIEYPAKGSPELANRIVDKLNRDGVAAKCDPQRGLDHGVFVPLKLMFPDADIPVIALSLTNDLNQQLLIEVGKSIGEFSREEVLIVGSGLSFHNLQVLMSDDPVIFEKSKKFDNWLNHSILASEFTWQEKEARLLSWKDAPEACFSHPREEHLLPLHVCFGAAQSSGLMATNIFNEKFLGTQVSAFLWQ